MMHSSYLPKLMANQLTSRLSKHGQKAALVFTSSISCIRPMPGIGMYSSTKVFTTYLARALSYEMKDTVDVIAYCPGEVDTNMNPNKGEKLAPGFITAERAAETCFRDLGLEDMSYGDKIHELQANKMNKDP